MYLGVVLFLSLLFFLFCIRVLLLWRKYGRHLLGENTCAMSAFMAPLGMICFVFLMIFSLFAYGDNSVGAAWGFLIFAILGLSLMIAAVNIRIFYDDNGFTYRNFFGIKQYYSYSDITGYNGSKVKCVIYLGRKKISIDQIMWNHCNEFIDKIRYTYRCLHGGSALPVLRKKDIFNGNISAPGEFIFVFFLMLVAILVGFIFAVNEFRNATPAEISDCLIFDVVIDSVEIDEMYLDPDNLNILCQGEYNNFCILYYEHCLPDVAGFLEECKKGTEWTFYVEEADWQNRHDKWKVISHIVDDEGNEWMSFEDSFYMTEYGVRIGIQAMFVCALILTLISVGTVVVGRNAHKLSPRVVNLFFKQEYVIGYRKGPNHRRTTRNRKK